MARESSRQPIAFIVVCNIIVLAFAFLPIVDSEICKETYHKSNENCSAYELFLFLFARIFDFVHRYEGAFTAASTIAVAVFTWRLWISTDRLWDEAKESRRLTILSVNAAGASANAASRSAKATERHLRAYVFVHSASITFDRGTIPQAEVRIANFGQTPAHDVRMWIHLWIEEWPLKITLPTPTQNFPMASSVLSQGTEPVTMRTGRKMPIPKDQLPLIGTPKGTIYVYGRIEYVDVFGERRWTNYRLIYGGSEGVLGDRLQPDIEGNDAN
jgi:hypothetical protein